MQIAETAAEWLRALKCVQPHLNLFWSSSRADADKSCLTVRNDGLLNQLSTTFSRNQAEKVRVQDRMREHGAPLWAWLRKEAHFYVCGDASHMAKDVDQTSRDVW